MTLFRTHFGGLLKHAWLYSLKFYSLQQGTNDHKEDIPFLCLKLSKMGATLKEKHLLPLEPIISLK